MVMVNYTCTARGLFTTLLFVNILCVNKQSRKAIVLLHELVSSFTIDLSCYGEATSTI